MSPAEQLRVAIFLAVVGLVLGRTALILMRWRPRRRRSSEPGPPPSGNPRRGRGAVAWLDGIVVLAALAGVLCVAYGYFILRGPYARRAGRAPVLRGPRHVLPVRQAVRIGALP